MEKGPEEIKQFLGKDNKPIEIGSTVSFEVENRDTWQGPTKGVLELDENGEFIIRGKDKYGIEMTVTIGKGYDAYPGTVEEIL